MAGASKLSCTLGLPGELSKLPMFRLHPLWIKSECLGWEPDISIFTEELGFESRLHYF